MHEAVLQISIARAWSMGVVMTLNFVTLMGLSRL